MPEAVQRPSSGGRVISYGSDESQFFRLWSPSASCEHPLPTVFFLHGGFWKSKYGIMPPTAACETLAPDLVERGFIVIECEYRRSGDEEWGWPHSNNDVLLGYRRASQLAEVDKSKIIVLGHSAGGTLALWLAAHVATMDEGCVYLPIHTIALAPVADLKEAVHMQLSDDGDAVVNYMHGTPSEKLEEYRAACPTCRAADLASKRLTLVIAERDEDIPACIIERLSRAIQFEQDPADAGQLDILRLPDANHYDLVQATSHAWLVIASRLGKIAFPHQLNLYTNSTNS